MVLLSCLRCFQILKLLPLTAMAFPVPAFMGTEYLPSGLRSECSIAGTGLTDFTLRSVHGMIHGIHDAIRIIRLVGDLSSEIFNYFRFTKL